MTFTPNERESDPFTCVVDKWVSSNKKKREEIIIIGFRGSGRRLTNYCTWEAKDQANFYSYN